jgi:hypothetical protein
MSDMPLIPLRGLTIFRMSSHKVRNLGEAIQIKDGIPRREYVLAPVREKENLAKDRSLHIVDLPPASLFVGIGNFSDLKVLAHRCPS